MKYILAVILGLVLLFASFGKVGAVVDPRNYPNNRFGIHIISPDDLKDTATLVNSSGGDWGYVTLVIREDERNSKYFQEVFERMGELHLIPIVRIATKTDKTGWVKPTDEEIYKWMVFLNSLPWPVANRYIVIGNEVNHATEWGGEVNPAEYVLYLEKFSSALKEVSLDYFVLAAAMDASAPNGKGYMSEEEYLKGMILADNNVFNYVDGWNSHSYPNPDFAGSPTQSGKGTVRTFDWELNYLKMMGIDKDLPVFITETGWAHNMNGQMPYLLVTAKVAEHFKDAFANAWNDSRVVAVTPFVLSHPNPPFNIFSWKDKSGEFYSFYYDLINVSKLKGEPEMPVKEILGIFDSEITDTACVQEIEQPKKENFLEKYLNFDKILGLRNIFTRS